VGGPIHGSCVRARARVCVCVCVCVLNERKKWHMEHFLVHFTDLEFLAFKSGFSFLRWISCLVSCPFTCIVMHPLEK